jgi:chromosome segregation ATPase
MNQEMDKLEEKYIELLKRNIMLEEEKDTVLEVSKKVTANQDAYVKQAFQYAQLKKDYEELTAKNTTLQSDNAELKSDALIRSTGVAKHYKDSVTKIEEQNININKLLKEIVEWKDRDILHKWVHENTNLRIDNQSNDVNEQKNTIDKLQKEIVEWKDRYSTLKHTLNENINNQFDDSITKIKGQNVTIDKLLKENDRLNMEKSESATLEKYHDLKNQFQKVEEKATLWEKKSAERKCENTKLTERLLLKGGFSNMQAIKITEQKESLAALRKQCDLLQRQPAEDSNHILVRRLLADEQDKNAKLRKDNGIIQERYVISDQSFMDLKESFNVIRQEYAKLLQIGEDSNNTIESLRIELADEQDKKTVLKKLRTDRTEVDKRNTELGNKITGYENRIRDLEEMIRNIRNLF